MGCEQVELFYTGSSVFRVMDGKGIISDRDFVVKIESLEPLKKSPNGEPTSQFSVQFSNALEKLLSVSEGRRYFGLSKFICNNSREEKWLIKLGNHDIDIVLSTAPPTYALLHQARAIQLGVAAQDDKSSATENDLMRTIVNGSQLVYLADPEAVEQAITHHWIQPGDAKVSWDKYGHIMKALAQGYRFKEETSGQNYFSALLTHLNRPERGGQYDLFVKFSNLDLAPTLQAIFELARVLDMPNGPDNRSVAKYFPILLGRIMGHLAVQRQSQLNPLLSMISSWSLEGFSTQANALRNTLSIHHLLNSEDSNPTTILIPFQLPDSQEPSKGNNILYLQNPTAGDDLDTFRERLSQTQQSGKEITHAPLEIIHTMAQQLGYMDVVKWIENPNPATNIASAALVDKTELDNGELNNGELEKAEQQSATLDQSTRGISRIDSVEGSDSFHSTHSNQGSLERIEKLESVESKTATTQSEASIIKAQRGVWSWAGHSYPLWDSRQTVEVGEDGLPLEPIELNYLGCQLSLKNFTLTKKSEQKSSSLTAEASLHLPSFTLRPPSITDWEKGLTAPSKTDTSEKVKSGAYWLKSTATFKPGNDTIDLQRESAVLNFDHAQFSGRVAMERHMDGRLKRILPCGRGVFSTDITKRSSIQYAGDYYPTGYAVLDTEPFGKEVTELTGWWIQALRQEGTHHRQTSKKERSQIRPLTLYGKMTLQPEKQEDSPLFVGRLEIAQVKGKGKETMLTCQPLDGRVYREDQPNDTLQVTTLEQVTMLRAELDNGAVNFLFNGQNKGFYELKIEHHTLEEGTKKSTRRGDSDQNPLILSTSIPLESPTTVQQWMAERFLEQKVLEGTFKLTPPTHGAANDTLIVAPKLRVKIEDNQLSLDRIILNRSHPNAAVPSSWLEPYRMAFRLFNGQLRTVRWPVIKKHTFINDHGRRVSNNTGQYFMLEYCGKFKQGRPIHTDVTELKLRGMLQIPSERNVGLDCIFDEINESLYQGAYVEIGHRLRPYSNGVIPWSERVVETEIKGRVINAVWSKPWYLETKSADPVGGGAHTFNPRIIFLDPRAEQLQKSGQIAITQHCLPKVVGGYIKSANINRLTGEADVFHVANIIVMPKPLSDIHYNPTKGQYPFPEQWYEMTAQLPKELAKSFNWSLKVSSTSLTNDLKITVHRNGAGGKKETLLDYSANWNTLLQIQVRGFSAAENQAINNCIAAARNALLYQQLYQYLLEPSEELVKSEPKITPQLYLKGGY